MTVTVHADGTVDVANFLCSWFQTCTCMSPLIYGTYIFKLHDNYIVFADNGILMRYQFKVILVMKVAFELTSDNVIPRITSYF